jgi:hypothetical protein
VRRVNSIFVLTLIVLAAGCSSISIQHDYDPSTDFTVYRTYAWIKQPVNVSGNARQAEGENSLVGKRIMNSVDGEMAKKGLRMADDPQLLVVYYTGVQDKVQVTDWGYGYGPYGGWGYGGGGTDVYSYQEGTLIVDLVDAQSKQLVWRGTAQGVLSETTPSPEQMQKKIDDVVGRMFEKYPPKK